MQLKTKSAYKKKMGTVLVYQLNFNQSKKKIKLAPTLFQQIRILF